MNGLAGHLHRRRKAVICAFAVLCALSAVALPFVYRKTNSDLAGYLPASSRTAEGLRVAGETFGITADDTLAVRGATEEEAAAVADCLDRLYFGEDGFFLSDETRVPDPASGDRKAVSLNIWRGSGELDLALLLTPSGERRENLERAARLFHDPADPEDPSDDVWAYMLALDFPGGSPEAMAALDFIERDIVPECVSGEYAIAQAGSTRIAKDVRDGTLFKCWTYLLAGAVFALIALILFSPSWREPFAVIATCGAAALINAGTNIVFKSLSVVSFVNSPPLQAALSAGFSLLFANAFAAERRLCPDPAEALGRALSGAVRPVCGCAAATAAGSLALCFSDFGIGAEIGLVLFKGMLISLLSVLFLQPALMSAFPGGEPRAHRHVRPEPKRAAALAVRGRYAVSAAFVLVLVLCGVLCPGIPLNSFNLVRGKKPDPDVRLVADTLSRQTLAVVPFDPDSPESVRDQYVFADALFALERADGKKAVDFAIGFSTAVPEGLTDSPIFTSSMKKLMREKMRPVARDGRALYTVGLNAPPEDCPESDECARLVRKAVLDSFPDGMVTGMSAGASEFAERASKDFLRVSGFGLLFVFLSLLACLGNVRHAVLSLFVTAAGVFLDLCLAGLAGVPVNVVSISLAGALQLGACAGYAVSVSGRYMRLRERLPAREAAAEAAASSVPAVLAGAVLVAGGGLCVGLLSPVAVLGEISLFVAGGAAVCGLLSIFVLPALQVLSEIRPGTPLSRPASLWDRISARRTPPEEEDPLESFP